MSISTSDTLYTLCNLEASWNCTLYTCRWVGLWTKYDTWGNVKSNNVSQHKPYIYLGIYLNISWHTGVQHRDSAWRGRHFLTVGTISLAHTCHVTPHHSGMELKVGFYWGLSHFWFTGWPHTGQIKSLIQMYIQINMCDILWLSVWEFCTPTVCRPIYTFSLLSFSSEGEVWVKIGHKLCG